MNLKDFINQHNGKYLEVAGSPGAQNQCVDLANGYIRDVLGLPIIEWTNARDFPSKAGDNYEWLVNTPTGVPQYGDLIIWQHNQYGHIAIYLDGDTNTFNSFDQNYPTGTPCHVQSHNYTSPQVAGWLRPKNQSAIIGSTSSNSPTSPTDGTMNDTTGAWASQADRILQEAKRRSIILSDAREDWVDDDKFLIRLFDHINTLEQVKSDQQRTIIVLEKQLQIQGVENQTSTDTPNTIINPPDEPTEPQKPIPEGPLVRFINKILHWLR